MPAIQIIAGTPIFIPWRAHFLCSRTSGYGCTPPLFRRAELTSIYSWVHEGYPEGHCRFLQPSHRLPVPELKRTEALPSWPRAFAIGVKSWSWSQTKTKETSCRAVRVIRCGISKFVYSLCCETSQVISFDVHKAVVGWDYRRDVLSTVRALSQQTQSTYKALSSLPVWEDVDSSLFPATAGATMFPQDPSLRS